MIEFRPYQPGDRETAIRLLGTGKGPRYAATKQALFDWQFFQNPHRQDESPFIVGTVGDEIVALNGFMPVRLCYEGSPARGSWSCDTYVSGNYRGQGFGKALLQRVSEFAPIMLGFGISDMSDPIFAKLQWELHTGLRLVRFHVGEPGLKGVAKNLRTRLAQLRGLGSRSPGIEVTSHNEDFGADVEELWQRAAPTYFSCVARDAAYLTWKYRRHPLHRYEWFAARSGRELRGLVVVRHSAESSVLVDYCGASNDVDAMCALVKGATRSLAARGTQRVQCETSHGPLLNALERCGYTTARGNSRFRVRTNRPGDDRQIQDWLVMPGDSDGDIPGEHDAVDLKS